MRKTTVDTGQRRFYLPKYIEDLSRSQFVDLAPFLNREDPEAQMQVGAYLLPRKLRRQVFRTQDEDIIMCTFIDVGRPLCQNRPENTPLKYIQGAGKKHLHFPRYDRLTAIEVAMAQAYLSAMFKTADEQQSLELLAKLCATLCRPFRPKNGDYRKAPDWNGDRRELYNSDKVDREAEGLLKLKDKKEQIAALVAFQYQMHNIEKDYKAVFSHRGEDSKPGPLLDIVFNLSGDQFGNYERVSHTSIHTLLYYLNTQLP